MKKLKRILFIAKFLSRKKIIFGNINKVDILIFGNSPKNFKFKKVVKVKQLTNEIYFGILLLSFIKFLFFTSNKTLINLTNIYFVLLIKKLSPKIAIGHEINFTIFKFKKFFPEKKAIVYQFVHWRNIHKDHAKRILPKNVNCDYFFVFDQKSKKFLNFLKTKFIISGSVKNNEISTSKRKKLYDIMFISEYRPEYLKNNERIRSKKLIRMINQSNDTQVYVLKILNKLIKKTGIKVCVALSSVRSEKRISISLNEEIDFFSKHLDKFYYENLSSYRLADKSKLCISLSSTLGPELLAKKMKVFLLMIRKQRWLDWEFLPSIEGGYWYKGYDENKIAKKIDYLLNLKSHEWTSELRKKNISYEYDKNNSKLKSLVYSLLKKNAHKV